MGWRNIYLFRHGQTNYNKRGIFTGWRDSKLTPEGKEEAERIAEQLKDKNIDIGYASDLSRSIDTLKIVLKYHPNAKVYIDPRIRERSYGALEGRSKRRFERQHPKIYPLIHRGYDFPPPQGESIKMVEARVLPFIKDLISYLKENSFDVAISAHGNSMRPMFRYFEHLTIDQMCKIEIPQNTYFHYQVNEYEEVKVVKGIVKNVNNID